MRNIETRQLLLILNQLDSLCIEIWDNQTKEYLDIDAMLSEARKARLEELRYALEDECISYGELAELQELIPYIEPGDVQLLEAAGVPEFPEDEETPPALIFKDAPILGTVLMGGFKEVRQYIGAETHLVSYFENGELEKMDMVRPGQPDIKVYVPFDLEGAYAAADGIAVVASNPTTAYVFTERQGGSRRYFGRSVKEVTMAVDSPFMLWVYNALASEDKTMKTPHWSASDIVQAVYKMRDKCVNDQIRELTQLMKSAPPRQLTEITARAVVEGDGVSLAAKVSQVLHGISENYNVYTKEL